MSDLDWRHLPPLTTLRAFEATARLGGYSAAARALNVTPAAIAQQVRRLEREVGVSLVRREGRGLALTEAGARLSGPLREAFLLMSSAIGDTRQREVDRPVRVSTTEFFVDAVILPNLRDFWEKNPGVEVSFSPQSNRTDLEVDAFDVFVRGASAGDEKAWDNLEVTWLLDTSLIVCGAPSLVGDGSGEVTALPWLADRSLLAKDFNAAVRGVGCDPDTVEIVDPGAAKFEIEAALLGHGLSVASELVVRDYLADGSLVRLGQSVDLPGAYWLVTRPGPRRENVRRFTDWLTALCAPLSEGVEAG